MEYGYAFEFLATGEGFISRPIALSVKNEVPPEPCIIKGMPMIY